jgi:hypothetical protein
VNCPLCTFDECTEIARDRRRPYYECGGCGLVFVPAVYHCTIDEERARYDLHDNTAANKGYAAFLAEVAAAAVGCRGPDGRFLDFGCGKEAILANILNGCGLRCDAYDPLYGYPFPALGTRYDAIVLCEVIEHCRSVAATLREVASLLTEDGTVIIRTQCIPPGADITRWWYAQDITHVNFFSPRSLEKAARLIGRELETTPAGDIFIARRAEREVDAVSPLP